MSIQEFGAYLCHAELWFPIGIMRTKLVHQIPGKYSAITKVLLERMWLHADSLDSIGVLLPIGKEDRINTIMTFRSGPIIADGDRLPHLHNLFRYLFMF